MNELNTKITVKQNDIFAVTSNEYQMLYEQFGDLCHFAAWQLVRKNQKNNHTEDLEDIIQLLNMAVIRAGRYYKRQVYIEACLDCAEQHAGDGFMKKVVKELRYLWINKTKHGANKKKFGDHQERLLESIIQKYVPQSKKPDITASLKMDKKFQTYCKAIAWNAQKSLGRKISRERAVRSGMTSLSEHNWLGGE
jgi:hypothetical protein